MLDIRTINQVAINLVLGYAIIYYFLYALKNQVSLALASLILLTLISAELFFYHLLTTRV